MRKRPAVSELDRHYSRFTDERQRIEEEIIHAGVSGPELRATKQARIDWLDLMREHLIACLGLVEPSWRPSERKRHRTAKPTIERRVLLSRAYDVLRAFDEPLSVAQIVELSARRADGLTLAQAHDQALRAALTTLLRGQARVGAVRAVGQRPIKWLIVRSPES